jgi:single-strand DNA-binding protein
MVNKIILIGNLGKDARRVESGHDYFVGLSIATNRKWKDKSGEWQKKVNWHDCIFSGKGSERILEFKKGELVYVEGSVENKKSDPKQTFVRVNTIKRMHPPKDAATTGAHSGEGNYNQDYY